VVEKIVKHRVTKRTTKAAEYDFIELMVKWDGYLNSDNTWEPLHCIYKDVPALCRQYFKSKNLILNCKFGAFTYFRKQVPPGSTKIFALTLYRQNSSCNSQN
jgi:hypothetical protein